MMNVLIVLAALGAAQAFGVPSGLTPNGGTVELLNANQRTYLAMDEARLRAALRAKDPRYVKKHIEATNGVYRLDVKPQPLALAWKGGACACAVEVCRADDGRRVAAGTSSDGTFAVWNLEAGCDYRWTVKDATGAATATFTTSASAPRLLNGGAVANVRDLGGWVGKDGRRIRQGRIFRSAGLNKRIGKKDVARAAKRGVTLAEGGYVDFVTETNRAAFADIKTDIDLRFTNEVVGMTASPIGPGVKWLSCPLSGYYPMSRSQSGSLRAVLDPANHPVVFHCAAGKDRTGTLSAYVLGLLGVSDADIFREYGFIDAHLSTRFESFVDDAKKIYGTKTFAEACEAHVKKLGISDADIARFREAMLEGK